MTERDTNFKLMTAVLADGELKHYKNFYLFCFYNGVPFGRSGAGFLRPFNGISPPF